MGRTIFQLLDIYNVDSPMCHFNKQPCACGDSQQHGEGPRTTVTKGVLGGMAPVLGKGRQRSSQVWADWANSQNSWC